MLNAYALAILLAADPSGAKQADHSEERHLIEEMNAEIATNPPLPGDAAYCAGVNRTWREAGKVSRKSSAFEAVMENFHSHRSRSGCLTGCNDDPVRCPPVPSLDARWRKYELLHDRLTSCLKAGQCPEQEVDDVQAALRPMVRVLLAEIRPQDPRWFKLLSGFSTVVGPDIGSVVLLSEKQRRELSVALAIKDKTRSPAMRAAINKVLDALIRRYATDDPAKAKEYGDLKTDWVVEPSEEGAVKVIRALDATELEEAQRMAERAHLAPVILAEYRQLRLYTTVELPAECPANVRPRTPACDPVYQIADQFFLMLDGRALSGTTATKPPEPLDGWLEDARTALKTGVAKPGKFAGAFAGGVGLRIQKLQTGNKLSVRAGFVVQALGDDPHVFDDGEEVRDTVDLDREPGAPLTLGKELADAVLRRSTLLNTFDRTFSAVPPTAFPAPAPPPPPPSRPGEKITEASNASSALIFAGLPYSRDARVPRRLADEVSAADFSTLLIGAGGILAGVYVHNTSDSPWADRFLEVGVVSIGVNVVIKAAAAAYYAHRYGGRP